MTMGGYQKLISNIKHHGREIYGVSYRPDGNAKYPMVIFSHGFNGIHEDFDKMSSYLAEKGVGSYCFDFCGGSIRSKSDLKTTEMTLFTEQEDLSAIIESVKQWDWIDKERIFLFGGSMGGLISALVADVYREDIKGLLLLFPALGIADQWNNVFPTLESIPDEHELWGVPLGKAFFATILGYDVFEHIGKYDKEVLIFHGDQDDIASIEYGKKASELYPRARIEVFSGEGHGFTEAGNARVTEMTYAFVKANG